VEANGPSFRAALAVAPTFNAAALRFQSDPINRIRLTAKNADTGAVLEVVEQDVDPNASEWTLSLEIDLTGASVRVIVEIELLNGSEVQWSGRTAAITVTAQNNSRAEEVEVFRGPLDNLEVVSVEITDAPESVFEGASATLTATASTSGNTNVQPKIFWLSNNPAVATIGTESGLFTALTPGEVRITATAGEISASVNVQVVPRPTSVRVTPDQASTDALGVQLSFAAEVLDANGIAIPEAGVVWSSSDSNVLRHDGAGLFSALKNGEASAIATAVADAALSAEAIVTVRQAVFAVLVDPSEVSLTAIGETRAISASPVDFGGTVVADAALQWVSSNVEVATVDGEGTITAVGSGDATVTVTGEVPTPASGKEEGRAASAAESVIAVVVAPSIASVAVTPEDAVVLIGEVVGFSAQAFDALGTPIAGTPVWSSSDEAVASVSEDGVALGLMLGSTNITATFGAISSVALLDVVAPDLTITRFEVLPEGVPGDVLLSPNILVQIEVTNRGDGGANASTLGLRLLDARDDSPVGARIDFSVPPLGPGASFLVDEVPPALAGLEPPELVFFTATADADDVVLESDEANNSLDSKDFVVPQLDLPPGFDTGWLGRSGTNWFSADNWSAGSVPGPTDNVFIPSGPTGPVLTGDATVNDLLIDVGATLELAESQITVSGNLNAGETITGSGQVVMTGDGTGVSGHVPALRITGDVALTGDLLVDGPFDIDGSTFTFREFFANVGQDFRTQNGAQLDMRDPAARLEVFGNTSLGSSGTAFVLTGGAMVFHGDFISNGTQAAFVSQADHRVEFVGNAVQQISFANPGAGGEGFGDVSFGANGDFVGASFLTDVYISTRLKLDRGRIDGVGARAVFGGVLDLVPGSTWAVDDTEFTGGNASLGDGTVESNVSFSAATTFLGPATNIKGKVIVAGTGILDVGGSQITATLGLDMFGGLIMDDPGDHLEVLGPIVIQPSAPGLSNLTAGLISASGPLSVTGTNPSDFNPGGTHTVSFEGSAVGQTLSFANPGPTGQNFNRVLFKNPSGTTLGSDAFVRGPVEIVGKLVVPVGRTISSGGVLDLFPGSTLDVEGTVAATACNNNLGAISGSGTHPCTPAAFSKAWTGTTDTSWFEATNWTPAGVPTATDDVLIKAGPPNQPVLSAATSVRDLTLEPGAALSIGSFQLTVDGSLEAGNTITGTGTVVMTGPNEFFRGTVPNIEFRAVTSLSGPGTATGTTTVSSFGGLVFSGKTFQADGDMTVLVGQANGGLTMTNASDRLFANGQLIFKTSGTVSSEGSLTAGEIRSRGDFSQQRNSTVHTLRSFISTGTRVVFDGTAAQSVNFFTPGETESRFQDVVIQNPAGVTFISDTWSTGLISTPGGGVLNATGAGVDVFVTTTLPDPNGGTYNVNNTVVMRSIVMSGPRNFGRPNNDLTLDPMGAVDLAGQTLTVGGDMVVNVGQVGAGLFLKNPADRLQVEGRLLFQTAGAASTEGNFTAGEIRSRGDFLQQRNSSVHTTGGFVSTGTKVVFDGAAAQSVTFSSPGVAASRFLELEVAPGADVSLTSSANALGNVRIGGTFAVASGATLTVGGTFVLNAGSTYNANGTLTGTCQNLGGTIVGAGANSCGATPAADLIWVGGDAGGQNVWGNANNWSPSGVPSNTLTVFIPAVSAPQPVMSAAASVLDLTVEAGATVDQGGFTLSVQRDLKADGTITNGLTDMVGSGSILRGRVDRLQISFDRRASGGLTTTGDLEVRNVPFRVGPQTVQVNGKLTVNGAGGLLIMQSSGELDLNGAATFEGTNSTGMLSSGTLRVSGDFTALSTNNSGSFFGSGTHRTVFDGTAAQTVSFSAPGNVSGQQTFQDVDFDNPTTVTLASNVFVRGTLQVLQGSVSGVGRTLDIKMGLVDAGAGLAVDVISVTADIQAFPPVVTTTLNIDAGVTWPANTTLNGSLNVNNFGLNLTDKKIVVNGDLDVNGASGVLIMSNVTAELDIDGNATFRGGSEVGSLTAGTLRVSGNLSAVSTNSTSSFHSTGSHKTVLDGVAAQTLSFSGPGFASTQQQIQNVDFDNPTTVTLASDASVAGTVKVLQGTVSGVGRTLGIKVGLVDAGAGLAVDAISVTADIQAFPPVVTTTLNIDAGVNWPANTTLNGSLNVNNFGLNLTNKKIVVNGDLDVNGASGVLIMSNVTAELDIDGNATFRGGNEFGSLTAGVLRISGNFTTPGTGHARSFAGTGSHETVFDGTAPQTINFANPGVGAGTEQFQKVTFNTTGGVTLASDVFASGIVDVQAGTVAGVGRSLSAKVGMTDIGGTFTVTNLRLTGNPTVLPATLTTNVFVDQIINWPNNTTVNGNLNLTTAGQRMNLQGKQVVVNGNLVVAGAGTRLEMQTVGGVLDVNGNASFDGGSLAARLTDGTMKISGDLTVSGTNSPEAFEATSKHTVILDGSALQTVSMVSPSKSQNHFANVQILNSAGAVRFATDMVTVGTFKIPSTTPMTVSGTGAELLSIFGVADVDGVTFSGVRVAVDNGGVGAAAHVFQNATFQNMTSTVTQLRLNMPGAATVTFSGLTFSTVPTGAGFYVAATTSNAGALTVDLPGSNPADGTSFESEGANTTINWAANLGGP
jgi:uncharacterized protein YjdB